jgi:NADP-dependent 3-hydroxy acid dehydrogenase YdfG
VDLAGKNVVVTGAAGGIGAALARSFSRAGANLTLADRDSVALSEVTDEIGGARPGTVQAVLTDVGTEHGNKTLIESARDAFGEVDLFFANAGVAIGTDLSATDEHIWHAALDINFHAHRWAAKHLLPEWLERGEGYFACTASAAGLLAQIGSAPYTVTKHAAVAFAEWLSITYGDRGIRVSCLCPQGVNTKMLATGSGDGAIDHRGGDAVRAAGAVLEASEVADITLAAIREERFLILPHPEVGDYERAKAADRERWLGGMRRFQRRVFGT